MAEFGDFGAYRSAARRFMGGAKPSGAMEGVRSKR